MLSEKQGKIIGYLRQHDDITLDKAIELIGYGIYSNHAQYVGQTLSRMVKRKVLKRVKPGLFTLPARHYCPDVDYAAIGPDDPEFEFCLCPKEINETQD